MSEAVQLQLIISTASIITILITHWLTGRRLTGQDTEIKHIKELSNSTLTHVTDKKEAAEHKLEQARLDELTSLKSKVTELEKQNALLTNPNKVS